MAKLTMERYSQDVRSAYFRWTNADTMVDAVSGVEKTFGLGLTAAGGVFDVIELPPGAIVVGGSVTRLVAFDTAGYDIVVGDATDDDEYLTTGDLKALGTTALVPTGIPVPEGGQKIRLTFSTDDTCTTGSAILRVDYIVLNRAGEVA